MKPLSFMLIAGEASGDRLAADLVRALRTRALCREALDGDDVQPLRTPLSPEFFGAGGPGMAQAGVELALDLTKHSVIGFSEVLKRIFKFRQIFHQLRRLAINRQPDVIIGVDYGGFNLRFGRAIKKYVRRHGKEFTPWNPRIVQFISPQVWASRPGRAYTLAAHHDLLLSIFPFEKEWYARRVPGLRVEYVGHPLMDRERPAAGDLKGGISTGPSIVLLPGSRRDEVRRHLPIVTAAFSLIRQSLPGARATVILPNDTLLASAQGIGVPDGITLRAGGLSEALATADLAITKSGTVTMECAAAGVPAVVFYRTSWPTYLIGRQVANVSHIAMPNLLAGGEVYPEFIQQEATPGNIAGAALQLLSDSARRAQVKARLDRVIASLGNPGATDRAAAAILSLLP